MIHRKEYDFNEEDYFEVEYLDSTILADDDIRYIVNNKIESLKEIYNKKTRFLYKKIKNL